MRSPRRCHLTQGGRLKYEYRLSWIASGVMLAPKIRAPEPDAQEHCVEAVSKAGDLRERTEAPSLVPVMPRWFGRNGQ